MEFTYLHFQHQQYLRLSFESIHVEIAKNKRLEDENLHQTISLEAIVLNQL